MFQFKREVTKTQIEECFNTMKGMIGKVPGLKAMEYGEHQSDEGLNDGFTHAFIMTFDSISARDAYLPHLEHEVVKDLVVPRLERVVVVDFEVNK